MVIDCLQGLAQLVEHRSQNRGSWVRVPQPLPVLQIFYFNALNVAKYFWRRTTTLGKENNSDKYFKFIQQSRQEASKIVWPNRWETVSTTVMVFILVAILATFFLITDSIISFLLRIILSLSF